MKSNNLIHNFFNKYPLCHSLNKLQVNKFIKLADPGVKDICRKIIDNTDHISFEKFLIRLNTCINELIIIINKYNFINIYFLIDNEFYDNFKNKSNFWIFEYIKQYIYLKSNLIPNIIIINNIDNKILKDYDIIIFVDDCIYSGSQISNTIFNMNNKKKLKLIFYILVPFISIIGKNKIIYSFNLNSNRRNNCNIVFPKNYYKPKNINDILNKNEITLIEKYYNTLLLINNIYLIYFDHKLADTISTFTPFYLGIVPNQKNLQILKFMNMKNYSNYLYLLDIIPIINKCEKYKNKISFESPKCPAPPYKKNFFKFINIYKKNIHKFNSLTFSKSNNNSVIFNKSI